MRFPGTFKFGELFRSFPNDEKNRGKMIGCEVLSLNSAYPRARAEVLTPPQSSPESHGHSSASSSGGSMISCDSRSMHPFEHQHTAAELGLPPNLPDILYCEFFFCVCLQRVDI